MATQIWTGAGDGITWSSTANWASASVPATGDDVYFINGSSQITAGLSQSAVTLNSLNVYPGFTGAIGVVGPTGASLAIGIITLVMLGSSGSNSGNNSGVFGSAGITLFKWTPGSVAFTATIAGTGASTDTFGSAVQIYGGTSGSNLYVNGGTVDVAMVPGQTATLALVDVSGSGTVNCGPGVTCPAYNQNGSQSSLLVSSATTTLTSIAGNLATLGTGLMATMIVGGTGTLNHRAASGNSITTLTVNTNGSANFSNNPAGLLIANPIQMYRGASLTAFSKTQLQLAGPAPIEVVAEGCGVGDLTLAFGTLGQTITIA